MGYAKNIKNWLKSHLPLWVLFILYSLYYLFVKIKVRLYARKFGIRDTSTLNIQRYKKSDTLFILGSGGSILDFTPEEWEIIRKSNSFGFNNWLIHDFVPTFYMFESDPQMQELMDIFTRNLASRAKEYEDVPFIYKGFSVQALDLNKFPPKLRQNLYVSALFLIPGRNVAELRKSIAYMRMLQMFSQSKYFRIHAQRRASISDLIIFGVIAGYKNIVLCGVDCNNVSYFFVQNFDYYKAKGMLIPPTGQHGTVHRTFDKNIDPVTIDEIVYALNDLVLKPQGINLYVALDSSALYPKIPSYFRNANKCGSLFQISPPQSLPVPFQGET